jgi:hypothetical protein
MDRGRVFVPRHAYALAADVQAVCRLRLPLNRQVSERAAHANAPAAMWLRVIH